MKAARQVDAVELMIASSTITVAYAEALLKATPPEQRTDVPPAPKEKTQYKDAEQNYGSELLNLVVAKGYLTKLLANDAVKSFIERHEPAILEQFELVTNTVSMEEALQQQTDGQPTCDTPYEPK